MRTVNPQKFDFVLFDACMMGCAEVYYELKDAARYCIASVLDICLLYTSRGFVVAVQNQNIVPRLGVFLYMGGFADGCKEGEYTGTYQ